MSLYVSIRKKLKYFDLDVDISCQDEELLGLIGPSGSGKSTMIRIIAGLEKPDEGHIRYGSEVWYDSSQRIHLPPQKRRLGYVFQDYTLFPHLTLQGNVHFAARDRKQADDLLDLMGIGHLRDRKPGMVSGGERQRCAICQALARNPRILLLDEPFSALDFMTRQKLRQDVERIRKEIMLPTVYVTHDIQEALTFADKILPIVEGKINSNWLQKAFQSPPTGGMAARAIRTQRLALAF